MSVPPWPDHLLGLDEWAALPEDTTHHYELVDGVLDESPRPSSRHQRALGKLFRQLDEQLPVDFAAVIEVEVVVAARWPATVRAPDLIVVPASAADAEPVRFNAEDVLLAVEVISPGSRKRDQVHKLYEYSEVGIPDYWLVDLDDPATLTACRLIDGEYEIVGQGSGTVELSAPAPVTVDVAALVPHLG